MTKAKTTKKQNGRWQNGGTARYAKKDAALLKRIREENGWRNGARVTKQ